MDNILRNKKKYSFCFPFLCCWNEETTMYVCCNCLSCLGFFVIIFGNVCCVLSKIWHPNIFLSCFMVCQFHVSSFLINIKFKGFYCSMCIWKHGFVLWLLQTSRFLLKLMNALRIVCFFDVTIVGFLISLKMLSLIADSNIKMALLYLIFNFLC